LDRVVKEWVRDTWRWGEPSLNPSVALTWVNGINYTNEEMEEQARFLSSLFGCRVRPYYNPSLGWWLRDLTRVSFMYIRSPTEDPVVTGLAKHLSMVLREVGPKGRVVHLAHSGGALLTYLVAKYHLKEEDRRRIDVINFGGARSITQKYFGKATNYYARNDPILLVNRRAMNLMQQLLNESADGEVIYLKHNTSFVFLQGRAGDRFADHSLVGPTYLTALNKEAAVFRRSYYRAYWLEGLTIAKPSEMGWGRFVRKRVAAATGFHNYFSNSTVVRLYYEGGRGRERGGAVSAWGNTTRAALRLPKRLRKYVRKKYYKLRGLPYVSAKSSSGKVKIIVPVKEVQQQQLQRHQQQQQQRSPIRIRPFPPSSSSSSSSSSWLPSWVSTPYWKRNDSQALALVVPPPRNRLFSPSSWFGSSSSSSSSIITPLSSSTSSNSSAPLWVGMLKNVSMARVGNWTERAQQRVRVVRKAAARWTGRRHFFAGREGKEQLLALEAERAAAAVAEAEKAAKGHPFLFFLRGNSGSGSEKGVVVGEEEEEEGRRREVLRKKEEEEKEKVAAAALKKEEEEKEEMGKKKVKEEEEEEEARKKEEEEEKRVPVVVAAAVPESEAFTILPPEAAAAAAAVEPTAVESPVDEKKEEDKKEAEKEELLAAMGAAAALTQESIPEEGGEVVAPAPAPAAPAEGEEVPPSTTVETEGEEEEEEETAAAAAAEIAAVSPAQGEGKDEEKGESVNQEEEKKEEEGGEQAKEEEKQAEKHSEPVGQNQAVGQQQQQQQRRRGRKGRMRIRRLKEEDPDLPLSAYLEQGDVLWDEAEEEDSEEGREEGAQQIWGDDGEEGEEEGREGKGEGKGEKDESDDESTDGESEDDYLLYDAHEMTRRYLDDV